jgi:uncharacterized protein YdbL (DUF1318 family)
MFTMKRMIGLVLAMVIGFSCVSFADAVSDAKDRRKVRQESVMQLLKDGAAEEGADGYLAAKKKEAEAVVKAENADRKIGYEAIAKSNNTSVDAIAKKAGEINRKKATQ